MKDIICLREDCEHNQYNHCINANQYLIWDEDGCQGFKEMKLFNKRITATNETETKADLKDAEKVASKREEK